MPRKDALSWLASATTDWQIGNGAPNLQTIADDLGVSRSSVDRIGEGAVIPKNETTVAMGELGAEAHGVPFLVAFHRIFRNPSIAVEENDDWFEGAVTPDELVDAYIRNALTLVRPPVLDAASAA